MSLTVPKIGLEDGVGSAFRGCRRASARRARPSSKSARGWSGIARGEAIRAWRFLGGARRRAEARRQPQKADPTQANPSHGKSKRHWASAPALAEGDTPPRKLKFPWPRVLRRPDQSREL